MIFFNHRADSEDFDSQIFTAEENSFVLGSCKLILNAKYAEITDVSVLEDNYLIIDGLIKAALNYACNRNYYMCRCSAKNIDSYLERMHFIECDGYYENDIPTVLTGSCNGCCK